MNIPLIAIMVIVVLFFAPFLLYVPLKKLERGQYVPVLTAFHKAFPNTLWTYALTLTFVFLVSSNGVLIDGQVVFVSNPLWHIFIVVALGGGSLLGALAALFFESLSTTIGDKIKPIVKKHLPLKVKQS